MTLISSLLSGMTAVFVVFNLALLVAAVVWAMGGFSGQLRERKLARVPVRQRKPTLRS